MAICGDEPLSEIQTFFEGTNVFVTGATGFIGHVLVEKLLRSCFINKLYLLVRPKKNKDPKVRLREMFSSPLFGRLWDEQPDFIEKVLLITGDCVEPNLGLSAADVEYLVAHMDIVIHCAATIKLNGSLKHTSLINVRSTRDLLLIARRMDRLKSFVFISTAFSNTNQPIIEEVIYDCHIQGDILIDMVEKMSDSLLDSITPECLGTWPNTYTLSKCVAENIVRQYGRNMPICIARPCIVVFTDKEPIPGWVTSLKSVPGVCLGIGLGVIHVTYTRRDCPAIIVPADKVANMIITSAWHASKTRSEHPIPVFNYVPNNMAPPLTFGQGTGYIIDLLAEQKLYSEKLVWKPNTTETDSFVLYTVLFFLYHYVPAFFADAYLWISDKKPRIIRLYRKIDIMMKEMKYFGVTEFKFDNSNVKALISSQSSKDKKLFDMDLSSLNWKKYFLKTILGVRKYVFNDPEDTTVAQKRYQKILMIYYVFYAIIYSFLLYVFYELFKMIFMVN